MTNGHVANVHPLLELISNRDENSKEPPPISNTRDSKGGGESGGSFCSDFLIPAFSNVGLTGFTGASLDFVENAVPRFEEIHGRRPDKPVANHMAERLAKFVGQQAIDVSVEPHRALGYIRSTLVPSVLEADLTLKFQPVDSEPKPGPERPADIVPPAEVALSPEAQEIWRTALEGLSGQVARPAFETWLSDTVGVSHEAGGFVVGTANQFVSEMLQHRMYPLIERAVEYVVDESVKVDFLVVALSKGGPSAREEDLHI